MINLIQSNDNETVVPNSETDLNVSCCENPWFTTKITHLEKLYEFLH